MLLTCSPAPVSATTQTSEISATSNAYSIRSCPSSSRTNVLRLCANFMSSPLARIARHSLCVEARGGAPRRPPRSDCLRRRGVRQLVLDRGEDVVHLLAGAGERHDADQRDQRHEERVLDQVLALFVANERVHVFRQIHDFVSARSGAHGCVFDLRPAALHDRATGPLSATAMPRLWWSHAQQTNS